MGEGGLVNLEGVSRARGDGRGLESRLEAASAGDDAAKGFRAELGGFPSPVKCMMISIDVQYIYTCKYTVCVRKMYITSTLYKYCMYKYST